MAPTSTTRRRYLLTAGAGLATALAGCGSNSEPTDGGPEDTDEPTAPGTDEQTPADTDTDETTDASGGEPPEDQNPDDGYPPEFEDQPSAMEFDVDSFRTHTEEVDGSTYEIPIVPLDVAYNLYARREARIVDARAQQGYDVSHVHGAVRSPSPTGTDDDPTSDWDTSDTVITYCHCPYHTALVRAGNLRDSGFETVYALNGGYQAWKVADHQTSGEGVPSSAQSWSIDGEADASAAGDVAYVYHNESDQVAGTEIDTDGTYTLEFSFASVSGSDTVTVGTPGYEVADMLVTLTGSTVTGDGSGTGTPSETEDGNGTTGSGFGDSTDSSTDDGGFGDDTTGNSTTDEDSSFGRLVGGRFR